MQEGGFPRVTVEVEKGASHRKRPRWKVAGRQSSSVSVLLPTGALKKGLHPGCPDRKVSLIWVTVSGNRFLAEFRRATEYRMTLRIETPRSAPPSKRGRAVATCFCRFRSLRKTSPSRS